MKLARAEIENYRAVRKLDLRLDRRLTVLHGDNGHGKTSVLSAIATGLGGIPMFLPGVSSIDFLPSDPRGSGQLRVGLTAVDDMAWERLGDPQSVLGLKELKKAMDGIVNADFDASEENKPQDLPIVAFYDTDRAVFDPPQRRRGFRSEFPRYGALEGALSARTDFRDFFEWFYAKGKDARGKEKASCDYQFNELDAVRKAVTSMIAGVSNPRIKESPLRFVVSVQSDDDTPQELSIDQLSGGYRMMLALAADLARRMAQGNPHLPDPLQSEAVVLIDEIELHLHPSWQQKVLGDLTRTFPNTQFIVSTHSPQVLTTVKPEHILELLQEQGEIVAGPAAGPTYGAEAGYVLENVMWVDPRPGGNEFADMLERYRKLVADGEGESQAATGLRQQLDALSPEDPALDEVDIEIRRRKLFQSMGQS